MTTNERAEELADTLRADGNLSMRFLGIFKTKIAAALRAQREEALEEAAKECDFWRKSWWSTEPVAKDLQRLADKVRALKTQTGGGDGNANG